MSVGALSLVMHVWCGTSRNRSLRSTLFTLLMKGTTKTMPGPLAPMSLPRVKRTSLSYSRTILTADAMKPRMITTTSSPMTMSAMPAASITARGDKKGINLYSFYYQLVSVCLFNLYTRPLGEVLGARDRPVLRPDVGRARHVRLHV